MVTVLLQKTKRATSAFARWAGAASTVMSLIFEYGEIMPISLFKHIQGHHGRTGVGVLRTSVLDLGGEIGREGAEQTLPNLRRGVCVLGRVYSGSCVKQRRLDGFITTPV